MRRKVFTVINLILTIKCGFNFATLRFALCNHRQPMKVYNMYYNICNTKTPTHDSVKYLKVTLLDLFICY